MVTKTKKADRIFKGIYPGHNFVLVLNQKNMLFGWGNNEYGQLGIEKKYEISTLIEIPLSFLETGESVKTASCGKGHTLLLTSHHRVFVSGLNDAGQLGLGHQESKEAFEELQFLELFHDEIITDIAAGLNHSTALTSLGRVFGWGTNKLTQLSIPTTTQKVLIPQIIELPLNQDEWVISLSTGSDHSVVLTNENRLIAWGENEFGQVGKRDSRAPHQIKLKRTYQGEYPEKIITTHDQTFILMNTHRYFGLGNNQFFRLGPKKKPYSYSPLDFISLYGDFNPIPRSKMNYLDPLVNAKFKKKEYVTYLTGNEDLTIAATNVKASSNVSINQIKTYVFGAAATFKGYFTDHVLLRFFRWFFRFRQLFTYTRYLGRFGYILKKPTPFSIIKSRKSKYQKNESIIHVECKGNYCYFSTSEANLIAVQTRLSFKKTTLKHPNV